MEDHNGMEALNNDYDHDDGEDSEEDLIIIDNSKVTNVRKMPVKEFMSNEVFQKLFTSHPNIFQNSSSSSDSWKVDELVDKRNKMMDDGRIRLPIDHYGMCVQNGQTPFINRPPLDDVKFFRNKFSNNIVGVVGNDDCQLIGRNNWESVEFSYFAQGSKIPDSIINHNSSSNITVSDSDEQQILKTQKVVPSSTYKFTYSVVQDLVTLFEKGTDHFLPGCDWTSSLRNKCKWDKRLNENYDNFVKDYIYVHINKEQLSLSLDTKIEKQNWRDNVRKQKQKLLNEVNKGYYDIALNKMSSQPLCVYFQIFDSVDT